MIATLISLALIFTELSLIAFGGGNAILPEMQRRVVEVQHWMSASEFSALFALAQAAPGPNMMVVPLVGWHVAGFAGVVVTSIAKFGPSSLITAGAVTLWERFKDRPWRRIVQAGLAPMTAGLVTSSAAVITKASATSPILIGIATGCAVLTAMTKVHPLIALGSGALIGLIFI
ncbi:chromate transporter [Agrobacterium vitis]|uniref:chromate transporter n=1 Tax=Agrobacterium vitis TaxID=373 RepID=UPI0012E747D2|nr:chromate transporter [Agrobacterium vitis]MVA51614.1 chromate transporter [Agrobacterium vitis]NSZ51575.1 chromate transporter [Agrobacterium vitis]NTA30334.1 chromate transporter [Agrobacterium vitis]